MKKPFLSLSINTKLIIMMLLLSFILISILLFFYNRSEQKIFSEIEKQTAELTKAIQIGVEEVTASGTTDEARLSNYLRQLNTKGIKEITIISNDDKIIASTIPTQIGKPITRKKKELIIRAELGDPVSDEGKTYNVIFPVISGGTQYAYIHHGYIHLKINKDDFSDLLKTATLEKIVVTIFVFLIGIIMTLIFSKHYTRPIEDVVKAAIKVANGDLTQKLPVNSRDEIGQLSESFNYMVSKLQEQKAVEERLREVEHLSAIGQLSRNIAHEIRNPLNYISLSIDYINDKYIPTEEKEKERFIKIVSGIKAEIQRLNNIVNDFLTYSKPIKLNRKMTSFNQILEDLQSVINAKAEIEGVKIVIEKQSDCELMVDPDLIKSCILNVVTNAFQAMQNIQKEPMLRISSDIINNEFVLTVLDNGEGVSKEDLPKVFEPFFTTKKESIGLGLGLSFTKRVIEEHGGRVEFKSQKGEGSEVRIILPLYS
ncbi:MAG: HAMP domain-containing histidine kinase [Thermodesulfovibrionales bacterium]|nr:HAMP domain-containing histidine kinase [Thermodesulfovibrionales bacterium]